MGLRRGLLTVFFLILGSSGCKTARELRSPDAGVKATEDDFKLSGDIKTAQIVKHDRYLAGKLPQGAYTVLLIPYQRAYGRERSDQECWDLVKVQKAHKDPDLIQSKYAKLLGFRECRAAPIVELLSQTCRLAFNCTGPNPAPSRKERIITLIDHIDLDMRDSGRVWPCFESLEETIKSVDGNKIPDAEYYADGIGNYVTFSGKNADGQTVNGCRFRVPLRSD